MNESIDFDQLVNRSEVSRIIKEYNRMSGDNIPSNRPYLVLLDKRGDIPSGQSIGGNLHVYTHKQVLAIFKALKDLQSNPKPKLESLDYGLIVDAIERVTKE